MNSRDLKRIEERANAATPGPWETFDSGPWGGQGAGIAIGEDYKNWVRFGKETCEPHISNSFFVAHAREDVPALVAAVRAERSRHAATLWALRAAMKGLIGGTDRGGVFWREDVLAQIAKIRARRGKG